MFLVKCSQRDGGNNFLAVLSQQGGSCHDDASNRNRGHSLPQATLLEEGDEELMTGQLVLQLPEDKQGHRGGGRGTGATRQRLHPSWIGRRKVVHELLKRRLALILG